MKRTKLYISILSALLLCICLYTPAFAAGNVSYEGKAEGFIFNPGTGETLTDLFTNFKNVMPGDELEETIEVRNNASGQVKIYMRATGTEESVEKFLGQMNLTIGHSTDSEFFNAAADQITGLEEWVLLGTLENGGNETLDLKLKVPIEMGNDYQNAKGIINWVFKVEDFTVYDEEKAGGGSGKLGGSVKTGDDNKIALLICCALIGLAGAGFVVTKSKRSKKTD